MNRATSVAAQLRKIQRDCGFLCSTTLSLRFGEMAAAWCAGAGWAEILDSTDLDEGDIVYGMRNTIDLLDQLARSPAEESLRVVASEARLALDRVPVSEIL
jgi:superfamily II RNA helicase